jgi:hypothetical protein
MQLNSGTEIKMNTILMMLVWNVPNHSPETNYRMS